MHINKILNIVYRSKICSHHAVDFKCSFTILSTPPALLFFIDLAANFILSPVIGWFISFAFTVSLFKYSVSSLISVLSLSFDMLVFVSL